MEDVFEEKLTEFINGHMQGPTTKAVLTRWARKSPCRTLSKFLQYHEQLLAMKLLELERQQAAIENAEG